MEILVAITVGVLYTVGVYMVLRRSILKFIIGILFFNNATNLLVFLAAGLIPGKPPFAPGGFVPVAVADPLPQAMILTAIVIGLGIVAFTLALKYKFFDTTGTDDLQHLKKTDN